MATKTISITDEAYGALRTKKNKSESFSDVIIRLSGKKTLASFYGALSEKSGKLLEEDFREGRKTHRKRLKKRLEKL